MRISRTSGYRTWAAILAAGVAGLAALFCPGCRGSDRAEPGPRVDRHLKTLPPAFDQSPWTRFGGPSQDFTVPDTGLVVAWPVDGPRVLWTRPLGPGYSGIVTHGSRLYTMYRAHPNEVVVCLDVRSGETVWEYSYESLPSKEHDPDYGDGPNSTPLVSDGRVYTIGIAGVLHCLDAETGAVLWSRDLWGELGGTVLVLGYSSSPIPFEETVIALVGGEDRGAVAFDKTDGRIVWQGLSFRNSYSTPVIFRILGEDQLVAFMDTAVVGADPRTGEFEWKYPIRNQYPQNICLPILIDEDLMFISTLEAGSRGLRFTKDDSLHVEELWSSRKLQCFYGSYVRLGDQVYGSSGDSTVPLIVALDARTGQLTWRRRGFSVSNLVGIGDRLLILDEDGGLTLATPSSDGLTIHAGAQVLTTTSRTPPTIVGSVAFVRDFASISALDLSW